MARPRSLFKILFYFNFFLVVVAGGGCPSVCSCVGRSTKCSRVHLTAVPRVPARTHTFDLRFNQISEIPPGAFSDLCNLTILLLNDNRLTQLKGGSFSGLPHLKHLYLYRNQIRQIDKDAFRDLDRLEQLYLHVNDIESFSYEVFSGLTRLERLYLHNNKIKHIQPDSFPLLMSLKHLRLDSNPLSCDCGMLWLVNALQLDKKIKAAATCYTPDYMTGRSLQAMTRETFSSCGKPIITKEPEDAVVKSGSDVTFVCEVEGEPQPEIIWLRDSDQLTTDGSRYSIMNNGTLKIQKSDLSDVGFFECLAVNPMGEVKSRSARMVVNDDRLDWPTFIIKPVNQAVQAGEPRIYLHCLTEGKPAPRIQWYHNNRIMLLSDRMHLFHNGTLLIKEVELADAGLYTCHAENIHAIISTSATVNILAPPKFYETPSLKKAVVGERVVFTCKARGYPPPIINWFKDTLAISPTANIVLNDNSQIITIMETSPADEGTYSCHAENSEGFVEASALLEVGDKLGTVAKLVQKPFDVDADLGSSIEMPCMGSGNPLPDVEWRKDGILVLQNKKRKISSFGSLFIYNITALDAGRYECSVVNEYGRDTGSGVLTISDSVLPGDKFVRTAFIQAVEEVDAAIENTIDRLFNHNETNKGDAFQSVRYPKGRARDLARSAEIFERTLVLIRNKVAEGMTVKLDSSFTYNSILSSDHIDLIEQLSGCTAHRTASECNDVCFHNKYRTNDGSCNNIKHPTWGASLTAFRRLMEPRYENGFNLPIGWSKNIKYNGHHLPSAREISTKIISTTEIIADSRVTHMVMQWGQWLDHDLDHALPSVSSQSWDGIDCKKSCEYAAPCFPMDVPPNDPRIHNRRCIDFIRTSAVCGSGMTSVFFNEVQPREQVNQLTSFIDASQVYGFSRELAQDLRDFSSDNGLLRVGPTFPGKKPLLPFAGNQGVDCRRNPLESSINCFVAGDIRANEQISLTAMHTIFMREHNRLVEELREINPFWDGETLYQEARKIVGAEIQFITYEHWLPIIVGPEGLAMLGEYIQYDSNLNPSISNVFATAALRFGHTMINPILHRYDENFEPIQQGHLELHNAFFAPWRLVEEGGVDPLMRGMFMTPAKLKTPTSNLNEELTEKLFHSAHAVALDLAAMNIQRGRDHAIPPYTQWRKFCNMSEVTTFDDLKNEITNADIRRKLKALYGTPQNIDVFVGGILEDQVQGGKVGPLFRCLLVEQFRRLRDGDRFWYENPTTFKPEQMLQIQKTSLARIICDNGDKIDTIGEDVFLLPEFQEGLIDCDDVTSMDMRFWADCQNCNNNDNIETVRARRSIDENPFVTDPLWSEKRLAHLENSYIQFESKVKNLQKRIEILETQCRLN